MLYSFIFLTFWVSQCISTSGVSSPEMGINGWLLLSFQTLVFVTMLVKLVFPNDYRSHMLWRLGFLTLVAVIVSHGLAYSYYLGHIWPGLRLTLNLIVASVPTFLVSGLVWIKSRNS